MPRSTPLLAILAVFLLFSIAASANPLRLQRRSLHEDEFRAVPASDALSAPVAQPPEQKPKAVRPPSIASAVEWCGTNDDIFTLSKLTLDPDPPAKGANLTVRVEGYLKETIVQGAYADVVVKIGVVKLLDTRLDLCAQGKEFVGEECPVQPGERAIEKTVEIPEQAPKVG